MSLELPPHEIIGIIGPNGAGKSTLLKAIMGLLPLDTGSVRIFGEPLDAVRQRVAYVPQKEAVDWNFPVSVLDVVLMGRYGRIGWLRRPKQPDRERAMAALEEMEMSDYSGSHISNLSGGQQQRVFLARALAQEAELLLLDEPFVGVDAATEAAIFRLLDRLRATERTVVLVNHDLGVVERFDRLIMVNQRLVAAGPPAVTFIPKNLQATYGGRLTILQQAEVLGK